MRIIDHWWDQIEKSWRGCAICSAPLKPGDKVYLAAPMVVEHRACRRVQVD